MKLEAVVHLEPPGFLGAVGFDGDDHERVRVDELELRDDAFDALLARAVVDGGDRVVRLGGEACERERAADDARVAW